MKPYLEDPRASMMISDKLEEINANMRALLECAVAKSAEDFGISEVEAAEMWVRNMKNKPFMEPDTQKCTINFGVEIKGTEIFKQIFANAQKGEANG